MQPWLLGMAAVVAVYVAFFGKPTPKPVVDMRLEPRTSGSYSSLVTALASSAYDPYLDARPTELGGARANTGEMGEEVTYGSLEEQVSE